MENEERSATGNKDTVEKSDNLLQRDLQRHEIYTPIIGAEKIYRTKSR